VNTLYISDLDGTLLDSRAALSEYTIEALNRMKRSGMRFTPVKFTIATARTWQSAGRILADILPLPAPAVLLNGALVYDTRAHVFVRKEVMPEEVVLELLRRVKAHGQTGFLYSIREGFIRPYHEDISHRPALQSFMATRTRYYDFTRTSNLALHTAEDIVYFTMQDTYEALAPVNEAVQALPGLACVLYPDSYTSGVWYLECFSRFASKYNAVMFLREQYGYDRVVGFGDNLNDLSLFAACDEAYAVANAREELKAAATGIIGTNVDDGVARFLEGLYAS